MTPKVNKVTKNVKKLLTILIFSSVLVTSVPTEVYANSKDIPTEEEIQEFAIEVADENGISSSLVIEVIEHESRYDVNAKNGNCVGLMQINKNYFKDMMKEMDIYDPYYWKNNIRLGVNFLTELFEDYGDPYFCLMIYNQGYKSAKKMYDQEIISSYAKDIVDKANERDERR